VIVAVLDANAFDVLAESEARRADVNAAVADGRLRLLTVHHVRSEVAAIRDQVKRERLLALATEDTPALFAWDRSAFGGPDGWASDEEAAAHEAVHTTELNHANDAQTPAVAVRHGATVVTGDERLRKVAIREGVAVLHPADLLATLGIA
jgi:rRNA-processing protein FCF1